MEDNTRRDSIRSDQKHLLTRTQKPIAKNALDMLINLSDDPDVLKFLAEDNAFIETIMQKITVSFTSNTHRGILKRTYSYERAEPQHCTFHIG